MPASVDNRADEWRSNERNRLFRFAKSDDSVGL